MKKILILLVAVLSLTTACKTRKKAMQKADINSVYETLKSHLKGADVQLLSGKVKVILGDNVLFDVNSATINPAYQTSLAKMASLLNKYADTKVIIDGYTDNTGAEGLNNQLSRDRADNAKAFLVDKKVSEDRISTFGRGTQNPIASNDNEDTRKMNRRVEFTISY